MDAIATEAPRHLLKTLGIGDMEAFYQQERLIPTSHNADVALILSHIAYWSGHGVADGVAVTASRGHSYRVKQRHFPDVIVRISNHYDHRDGVTGWNA